MAEHSLELAQGLAITWDLDRARSGDPDCWRLEGTPGSDIVALRVLTGLTEDGKLVLLAAARPAEADGHDSESPAAVTVGKSDEATAIDEALLSTQYAGDGTVTRIGLELYPAGDDYPMRGAGDVTASSTHEADGRRHERSEADLRLDGDSGSVVYEIVRL